MREVAGSAAAILTQPHSQALFQQPRERAWEQGWFQRILQFLCVKKKF